MRHSDPQDEQNGSRAAPDDLQSPSSHPTPLPRTLGASAEASTTRLINLVAKSRAVGQSEAGIVVRPAKRRHESSGNHMVAVAQSTVTSLGSNSEVPGGFCQDLLLLPQDLHHTSEPGQILFLIAGRPLGQTLINIRLADPRPDRQRVGFELSSQSQALRELWPADRCGLASRSSRRWPPDAIR